jgi:putative ABC transport system permease protein
MGKLWQDVRYAARTIGRARSVAPLAVLAFALGIGVTTSVFSIFNGVLLSPLPFPDPDELVAVFDTQPACATCPASYPKYIDWKMRNRVFAAIGGSTSASFTMTGKGAPERVSGAATTASLMDVFRVPPQTGRWYTEEEDRPGGPKVVVLGYEFWQREFGGDPTIVGRTLTLDGAAYQVIGVMPASFTHRNAEVYVPLQRKLDPGTRGMHFLSTYARLQKGVTVARAAAEMRTLGDALAKEFGNNHGIDVQSYYEVAVGSVRGPLQVLLGAVFFVLLIACVNVANLLLASGLARRREIAVRLAIGAGHKDIARQLTLEAMLLSLTGGAIGLALAFWIVRVFVALAGNALPRAATIHIDGRVLLFTAATSLLVGIVCGLWPLAALRLTTLTATLREADTRTGSSATTFGRGLVVAEIAFAFTLLAGAGLLVKNLMLLERRDAGIRTDHVIAFDISPSGPRYGKDAAVSAFDRSLVERLSHIPGVEHAALISDLPMYNFGSNGEMTREGGNPWGPNENPLVEYRYYDGDYLSALGIPLIRGRALDARDGATKNVLINKAMADKFWPGADPIGKRFGQGSNANTYYTVVGVIGNIRSYGLARTVPYEFYQTTDQVPRRPMTVVLRSSAGDPSALIPAARAALADLDPALPIRHVQTMEEVVSASVAQPRLLSALSGLFGGLAGLLAMVGVYGVTAYNVRRQRREYGIRLALGADPGAVRRLIIGRGATTAVTGIAVGLAGALLLTRLLQSMLNDVKATDPSVFALNGAVVFAVCVAACYVPARWASRVDPALALRIE